MISAMKKILYILIAGIALSLSSCEKDEQELFDAPVSERIARTIAKYEFALHNVGTWVMEYYPDDKLSYGGWIYVVEFGENNKVKAWFEGDTFDQGFLNSGDMITESDYVIEFSTGPMLKFTSHNDFLHYFAFPDGSNGGYQGRRGDFEFTLMSISEAFDEIIMRGIKTGNSIRLTPLSGEYSPESYIQAVRNAQSAMPHNKLKVLANGEQIGELERANKPYFPVFAQYASSKVWTLKYNYQKQAAGTDGNPLTDENGDPVYETVNVSDQVSVIHLPNGVMKIYEPYEFKGDVIPLLKGQTMQTFVWTQGISSPLDCYASTDSFFDIKLMP